MITIHRLNLRFSLAYLIEYDGGMVLVDAGSPGEEDRILRELRKLEGDQPDHGRLRLIYITHAHLDHYGAAAALRRLTGAPVAVHQADRQAMASGETELGVARGRGRIISACFPLVQSLWGPEPAEADLVLQGGDSLIDFGLDATVLHTPGHTTGSTSLLLGGGELFAGDLLSTTGGLHLQRFYAQDWSLLEKSLEVVRAAAPTIIYPGHGRAPADGAALQAL